MKRETFIKVFAWIVIVVFLACFIWVGGSYFCDKYGHN